jgi:hypothetical protein
MKGGAVALDGRIDPGDMILQVNEIGFDNMSNDDAVRVLKEVVQKPGPIKLVVAKVNKCKLCCSPNSFTNFSIPKSQFSQNKKFVANHQINFFFKAI